MLVQVSELRQKLNGVSMTEGQQGEARALLAGLQSEIELFLNRPVEPVHVTEWGVPVTGDHWRLAVTPVHAIVDTKMTSSFRRMVNYEGNPALREEIDLQEVLSNTGPSFGPGHYSSPNGLSVSYIGGLTKSESAGIAMKILEIAARVWTQQKSDAIGLRDGQPAQAEGSSGPYGWTDQEKMAFYRLRRRVVR